ncbi:hydrolase, NUDIX family protein [Tritrichomonas foetus]|uniref:Hydrolase, NUDIX family protein n=1 Tax=Tritrichomonas foetus TaxID=1144522 RepID=A0A1J4JJS1_9EUKA|nr:hydrolase, NUDIX family protein [Tritrichomonas foetus]|eukprot:OHS98857.1 hydrolase, NUDIX family protein [Tritrichomonas foetus]
MQFPFRDGHFDFIGDAEDQLKQEVVNNQLFKNWIHSLDESLFLKSVELQSFIRSNDGIMNYIKISTVTERNGGKIPRIIILQGYAISTLVVLHSIETKEIFAVLLNKVFISTGNYQNIIPFEITGVNQPDIKMAAEFIKKETTIDSEPSKIINLPEAATNNKIHFIHPYCGPTDQCNFVFLYEKEMHDEEIKELDGKEIRPCEHLKIIPINEAATHVRDFVSLAPFLYYEKLHENDQTK